MALTIYPRVRSRQTPRFVLVGVLVVVFFVHGALRLWRTFYRHCNLTVWLENLLNGGRKKNKLEKTSYRSIYIYIYIYICTVLLMLLRVIYSKMACRLLPKLNLPAWDRRSPLCFLLPLEICTLRHLLKWAN